MNDPICDDCRTQYVGPPYFTFPDLDCFVDASAHNCTGNLCPGCSCDLEPDDPDDPRRPAYQAPPSPTQLWPPATNRWGRPVEWWPNNMYGTEPVGHNMLYGWNSGAPCWDCGMLTHTYANPIARPEVGEICQACAAPRGFEISGHGFYNHLRDLPTPPSRAHGV